MKIVVLVKEVPDTYGDRTLSLETGLAERTAGDVVLDEIDERALEVALQRADADPATEVVVLGMGPESVAGSMRKALAMGAGAGYLVADDRLLGADVVLTAEVLGAAAKHLGFDLILAGNQSTDGSGGAVPAAIAEILGLPCLTSLTEVEIGESEVTGVRATDGAAVRVAAPLPAVVSITEALPDARFPTFKGITSAKKKTIEVLSPADLGVDPEAPDAARSIMIAVRRRPPRAAGITITDTGDAAARLADFLVENRLA